MNDERSPHGGTLALTALKVLMALILLGLAVSLLFQRKIAQMNHKLATETAQASGFPASEKELLLGKFYLCNASIVEERPTRTNQLAVLQQMEENGSGRWKAAGTNRLFDVPQYLKPGTIYQIGSGDRGVLYSPIAATR